MKVHAFVAAFVMASVVTGCSFTPNDALEVETANKRIAELTEQVAAYERAAAAAAAAETERRHAEELAAAIAAQPPPRDCTEELVAMKSRADAHISKLVAAIADRDATIARLTDAYHQAERRQLAAPAKRVVTRQSGLAGPRRTGAGGVHVEGQSCSIPGHHCGLPPP